MLPYIDIFSFRLPTYGLVSLVGIFLACFWCVKIADKKGISRLDMGFVAISAGIGLFLGAHLLYAITRAGDIAEAFRSYGEFEGFFDFAKHLLELVSGMVFYGGLYGALCGGLLMAKKKKLPIGDICDIFAVFAPMFHIFGRIACFLAGCCYGVHCDFGLSGRMVAIGVREDVKRFPVQLVEAFAILLILILILVLQKKNKCKGNLLFVYLTVYAVVRFSLEFLRGDEIRGKLLMFSTSQWISLITILWVSIFLIARKQRKIKSKE